MEANLKYSLIEKLVNTEDDAVLNQVKDFLEVEKNYWDTLNLHLLANKKADCELTQSALFTDLGIIISKTITLCISPMANLHRLQAIRACLLHHVFYQRMHL